MKKNNGFTLIESIIMMLFLAIALLLVYRGFTTTLEKDKIRYKFDNTLYIYRTYFMIDYLKANGIDEYLSDSSLNDYVCTTGEYNNGYCYTSDSTILTSSYQYCCSDTECYTEPGTCSNTSSYPATINYYCDSGWSDNGSKCTKSASSTSCDVNTSGGCTKYYKTCDCNCKYKSFMPDAKCNYTDPVYGTRYENTNTCSSACQQHAETMDGDWFYCSVVSGSCYENGVCVPGYGGDTTYSCASYCDYSTGSGANLSCYEYYCSSGSLSGSTCSKSYNINYTCPSGGTLSNTTCNISVSGEREERGPLYTCANGWTINADNSQCYQTASSVVANGYKVISCELDAITNKDHCRFLVENYNIDKMYLVPYQNMENLDYNKLLPSLVDYIKTLNYEGEGFRLIVKYKNGEYASLKVSI